MQLQRCSKSKIIAHCKNYFKYLAIIIKHNDIAKIMLLVLYIFLSSFEAVKLKFLLLTFLKATFMFDQKSSVKNNINWYYSIYTKK